MAHQVESLGSSNAVVLLLRFQGAQIIAEDSHLKFPDRALIPAELKKILELVKRVFSSFVLETMPREAVYFDIHPHVARPDAGQDQQWLASIEASTELSVGIRSELQQLAFHVLSRITHGTAELFSAALSADESREFDDLDCVSEQIEKFIQVNGGRPLQQTFSVSLDLNSSEPIIVSGHVREPELREFQSEDVSGIALVDGFRASKNEVFLFPVEHNRALGKSLSFKCTNSDIFLPLAEAHATRKMIRYVARTIPKANAQGVEQEISAIEIMVDNSFELE
ncbi:hypothetical protein [Parathalassolituus penaei]|uniref:Uncharacterized protein n=1 Tax=Parathalassolituus penaei TaxID=2997323 RepID=A0A9X3EI62_9GAMM|nr:hypothetical protein [Parathalassolituus penaei]MCY0967165.1 hypothetical protein [Parathalassolituus penaei]